MNQSAFEKPTEYLERMDVLFNVVTVVLTLLTNGCLLGIELKLWYHRKHLSQPNMLIIFLTIINIFFSLLGILPRILIFNWQPCTGYVVTHMMVRFLSDCSMNVSKLTVVLMGIERFIAIQVPFFYIRKCTVRSFCGAELVLVLYALLKGSFSVFFDFKSVNTIMWHSDNINDIKCGELFLNFESAMEHKRMSTLWKYNNAFTVLQLTEDAIVFFVLLFCNMAVMWGIDAMEKRRQFTIPIPLNMVIPTPAKITSNNTNTNAHGLDIAAIECREFCRLMIVIIVAFILLITPDMLRTICNQLEIWPSFTADFICRRVAISSMFINPFVYGLLRRKVRKRILTCIRRIFKCCRPSSVAPVECAHAYNSRTCILQVTSVPITQVFGNVPQTTSDNNIYLFNATKVFPE